MAVHVVILTVSDSFTTKEDGRQNSVQQEEKAVFSEASLQSNCNSQLRACALVGILYFVIYQDYY